MSSVINTEENIKKILNEIQKLMDTQDYEEAVKYIDENRLYLQKNADMKSQNLLNKTYAKAIYHVIYNAYSKEKNEAKFLSLFETHRSLIEVYHVKSDYFTLLRIYEKIGKKKKNRILIIVVPLLVAAIAFVGIRFGPGILSSIGSDSSNVSTAESETTPSETEASSEETSTETGNVTTTPAATTAESPVTEPDTTTPMEMPEYLLPSSERILTLEDVQGMNASDIRLAINEMYARHGYYFEAGPNHDYFSEQSWYNPNPAIIDPAEITKNFTDIEHANLSFLATRERAIRN